MIAKSIKEKTSNDITTAGIYCRVSTKEQLDGYSLNEQAEVCKEYIKSRGINRYRLYREEGLSGRNLKRPELQKMFNHIEEGKINLIVVWKLNRLSRNFLDSLLIMSKLDEINVGIVSLTEKIDTSTIIGKIVLSILMGFSQMEVENISENIKMGLKARAKEGKWNGGRVPFGYKYNGKGYLKIDKNEAKVINLIFKKYIQKKSINWVTYDLNKNKIINKKGKKWNNCTIRYILINEIYMGKLTQCGETIIDENLKIIDEKTFQKVQKLRENIRKCYLSNRK